MTSRPTAAHVVLVEDNRELGEALAAILADRGCAPSWCRRDAVPFIVQLGADVVVFDAGRPDTTALRLLRRLRRLSTAPVLVVVDAVDHHSTRELVSAGAARVVARSVGPDELVDRIQDVARRAGSGAPRVIRVSDVTVDLDSREVLVGGEPVVLSVKAFDVLAMLAGHAGRAVSRQRIVETVWGAGYQATSSRSLDVHIAMLRTKLNRPELIQTIYGYGYRLTDAEAGPAMTSTRAGVRTG
jgi:DNA-binding response OmpR family regulator